MLVVAALGASGSATLAGPSPAFAQDERIDLMAEPTGYTDVADAFDADDPLDVNVRLGFTWSSESAGVERERTDATTADGRPSQRFVEVAEYQRTRNALHMGLEVGVYHDVMLFAHMPVVLAEERELRRPAGVDCDADPSVDACARLTVPLPEGGREPLFELSPTLRSGARSGLPQLDLGVAWGVINQHRDGVLANWVLRAQLTLPTGAVMRACVRGGDRCDAGISDGQSRLRLGSRWSYRFRYVEPLLGLGHTFAWVSKGEDLYNPAGELEGQADDAPPAATELTLGLVAIPWEDRSRHQRFALDTRASAVFVSEGRDVSPLFDALGTSPSQQLQAANVDDLTAPEGDRREVMFTGITRVESHARLSLRSALVIQAARYVRFNLGVGLSGVTTHLLTGEPPCNPAVELRSNDLRHGTCIEGIPNPAQRPVIDAPGHRFRAASHLQLDLFASAAGQF